MQISLMRERLKPQMMNPLHEFRGKKCTENWTKESTSSNESRQSRFVPKRDILNGFDGWCEREGGGGLGGGRDKGC